ncbi:MAG: hypothetical protein Q3983_07055 [Capnocytophaga sp.]|nr:hypothetical protein [Capnocytophaga sp.]
MKKILILALCIAFSNCNKFDQTNVVENPAYKKQTPSNNTDNSSDNQDNSTDNNSGNNSGNSTDNQNNNSSDNSSNNQNNSGNNSNQNNNSGNSTAHAINSTNFGKYLLENGFDTDKNGTLEESEIRSISSLNLSGKNLSGNALSGIEYLTDLEILDVSNNSLTELTLKGSQLVNINVSNNQLTYLDISGVGATITGIFGKFDATGNSNLTCIKANSNHINATTLFKDNWKKDANCNFNTNC